MQAAWSMALAAGLVAVACGSSDDSGLGSGSGGTGGANTGGANTGGANTGGANTGGANTGGASGSGTGGTATGGAAGAATGGSAGQATGGAAGGGPVTCADLETAYAKKLAEAKVCGGGPLTVCTKLVPNELACPCETFVNANNTDAITALEALEEQWGAHDCGKNVACPEIACQQPASAICSSSGGKGSQCVDVSVGGN